MNFENINWLVLIGATVSAFVVGFVWYMPQVFGKAWQNMLGLTNESMKNANMAMIFGTAFGLSLIMCFVLYPMVAGEGLITGIKTGFTLGAGFVATTFGVNYLYQRKPIKLYLIDVGYQVLTLVLMGAIIGQWG